MARVEFADLALEDLWKILVYVEIQSGERRSLAVEGRIVKTLANQSTFPLVGKQSHSRTDGSLSFSINPWVVIYRPLENPVGLYVLRILDGRRDLSEIL